MQHCQQLHLAQPSVGTSMPLLYDTHAKLQEGSHVADVEGDAAFHRWHRAPGVRIPKVAARLPSWAHLHDPDAKFRALN